MSLHPPPPEAPFPVFYSSLFPLKHSQLHLRPFQLPLWPFQLLLRSSQLPLKSSQLCQSVAQVVVVVVVVVVVIVIVIVVVVFSSRWRDRFIDGFLRTRPLLEARRLPYIRRHLRSGREVPLRFTGANHLVIFQSVIVVVVFVYFVVVSVVFDDTVGQ